MRPIEQLHSPMPDGDDTNILDVAITVKANLRLLVITPIIVALLVLAGSFAITPKFTSIGQIMIPQQNQGTAAAILGSLGGLVGAAGGIAGVKNPADQWIGLLESRVIADSLVDHFKLRKLYNVDYQFQALKELDNNTTFTAGKNGLITMEVTDTAPDRAQAMGVAYINELQKLTDKLAVTEAAQRRLFFEKQLLQTKDNLIKAETALIGSGISPQILKSTPEAAVAEMADLKAQVTAQEVKISVLSTRVTDSNPDLQAAKRELESLRGQLFKISKNETSIGNKSEYISKYREFKYHESLFELLSKQFELAKIDEAREGSVVQVVDSPSLPEWKSSPKRGLITALAYVAALIGALLYIFTREAIRSAINDPDNKDRMMRWNALHRTKA
jgi:uncharacterized protein involved in exopolysaccharide biosynthesis